MAELKWKDAIIKVLSESSAPLHYEDITKLIVERKLRTNLGATPDATVNAQISSSIKHDGEKSPFRRTGRGEFALRTLIAAPTLSPIPSIITHKLDEVDGPETSLIQAFGMYWDRDQVDWTNDSKLWGRQSNASVKVDMAKQIGVYVLYDGHTPVYVGRSVDRAIGLRLYEHTKDRLRARWNRFSWFGLLPVSEQGTLGAATIPKESDAWIHTMEALLIEVIEPPLNRRRGDDIDWAEFIQEEDPEFTRKRENEIINRRLHSR